MQRLEVIPRLGDTAGMMLDPTQFLLFKHLKYGPVSELKTLYQTYIVLSGMEAAAFVSSRDGRECLTVGNAWKFVEEEFSATATLVTTDGQEHKEIRGALQRGYSRDAIAGRYHETIEIIDHSVESTWQQGSSVPVVTAMQSLVIRLLGTLMSGSLPSDDIVESISYVSDRILKVVPVQQIPKFMLRRGRYLVERQRVVEFASDTLRVAADRRNKGGRGSKPTLIDDILDTYQPEPGGELHDNTVINALLPFFAGIETTASTTSLALYMILSNPSVLDAIHKELDQLFANDDIEYESLFRSVPTLHGAINETMRLHPVAATLVRFARKDFEFHGYRVRKGSRILAATSVSHFLADCYENPSEFDVQRYSARAAQHRQPGAYSPFGRGEHMCIGKGVAEELMMIIMARLLYRSEMILDPPDYQLKKRLASTGPAEKFAVRIVGNRHVTA